MKKNKYDSKRKMTCYLCNLFVSYMHKIKNVSSFLGLSRNANITQMAAYGGKKSFNQYVSPNQYISTSAAMITGISYSDDKKQSIIMDNR